MLKSEIVYILETKPRVLCVENIFQILINTLELYTSRFSLVLLVLGSYLSNNKLTLI